MNTNLSALAANVPAAAPCPRSTFRSSALLTACCVLSAACGQPNSEPAPNTGQPAALTGEDGDFTVTTSGAMLNRYAVLAANASKGDTSLSVMTIANLNHPNYGPLSTGDLLLILQMQGASINTSNSPTYGTVTNLNSAGLHEFAVVQRIDGNTVHLACSGLQNSYLAAGRTQVVRVPQLRNLTIASGGSIAAMPWNGQRGGVVALHVEGNTTLSGNIDVSGQGFRGGVYENASDAPGAVVMLYVTTNPALSAEKGESIAGDATVYQALGGRYGRGAPANGGGGGNSHNAGGGGGANGDNGQPWTGQGVMSNTVKWFAAWKLDPGYMANGNAPTNSAGGGRAGYSFSSEDKDALTVGPNNLAWKGNNRSEVGGLGGRPVENAPGSRLFLGGGGGAGDGNDNAGTSGGNGGGLVYLISSSVSGLGSIHANGRDAQDTRPGHNDAPGGGGGGGTIVILSDALSGISVEANGGRGGSQLITNDEAEGPGGGGGGGYIALRGGTVTTSVLGGQSGTTSSDSLTEFPVNGSTFGATGQVVTNPVVPMPWLMCGPIDLGVTVTNGQVTTTAGTTARYTVTLTNTGPATATNAPISVPLPANATGATWTCTATAGASCQAANGSGAISIPVTLSRGAMVTFTFELNVNPLATGTLAVTATASEPALRLETNPVDNTATDIDTVFSEAELSVLLIKPAEPTNQGSRATYTVQIANSGPNVASKMSVTFQVPEGSTFSGASGRGWACAEVSGVVTCTRPSLPTGDAPDISIAVVPMIGSGTINATVSVASATADPNQGNNTSTATTTVSPLVDTDLDGIPDSVETATGTDPRAPDSDDDGLTDGEEDANHDGQVDANETNPRDPDTDNDGVNDGDEVTTGTDPLKPDDDTERQVVGGSCSASGTNGLTGALWVLLALAGLAFRKHGASASRGFSALLALSAVGMLAASAPAHAQTGRSSAIDVQQFKPAPGKADVLGLYGAGMPGHFSWRAGLYLHYAHEPLVAISPLNDSRLQYLVKNQLGFDLTVAIGLDELFELGVVVPLNLQQGEFTQEPVGNLEQTWKGGLGDLRLVPKVLLLNYEGLRLALALPVVLPTGGATALRGQRGLGSQPRLAADYAFKGGSRVLANVGIHLRSREDLLNLSVGNELSYGVGAAIPFNNGLTGMASLAGALGLSATGGTDEEEVPLELQAGVQYQLSKNLVGTLGLGRGLTPGYGMPVLRMFTGVSWTAEAQSRARPKDPGAVAPSPAASSG